LRSFDKFLKCFYKDDSESQKLESVILEMRFKASFIKVSLNYSEVFICTGVF